MGCRVSFDRQKSQQLAMPSLSHLYWSHPHQPSYIFVPWGVEDNNNQSRGDPALKQLLFFFIWGRNGRIMLFRCLSVTPQNIPSRHRMTGVAWTSKLTSGSSLSSTWNSCWYSCREPQQFLVESHSLRDLLWGINVIHNFDLANENIYCPHCSVLMNGWCQGCVPAFSSKSPFVPWSCGVSSWINCDFASLAEWLFLLPLRRRELKISWLLNYSHSR